jgi:MFS family permease
MSTLSNNDPKRVNFLRRGFTQVLVISIVCFCCPGFFNALTGLGGAGSNNPSTNAASNAILYAFFAIFGYFGGAFFNLFGPRVLMALGGLTYAFYSGAKYLEGQYPSLNWLFLVSGGVLGIGAAFLWCAQGSLMLAYAPKSRLGFYIATFWTIFNIGGLVGGFIQFGMNYNNVTEGSASAVSYFTFTGVMVAGAIIAALFLVDPATVVKEDGTEVVVEAPKGPKEEFRDVLSVILDKNMLLLFMLFFGSNFFYTYVFNGVNGFIFTLRTRGLNSALYWASQMVGAVVIGRLLDNTNQPSRKRAFTGFLILALFMNVVYSLGCYLEYGYLAGYNKSTPIHTVFRVDFKDWDYWYPAVVFILYGLGDAMIQA